MINPEETTPADGAPFERLVKRVRINIGALVSQDHAYGRWPWSAATRQVDPDMVFEADYYGKHWECRAAGYGNREWLGERGGYGDGAINAFGKNSVTLLDDTFNAVMSRPAGVGSIESYAGDGKEKLHELRMQTRT